MTIRHFSLLCVAMAGLCFTPSARGQFFENYWTCFQRVNKWPEPWICPDRQAVRAPIAIQTANGWRRQNMLTDLHFTDNNQLTEAGELMIRWILVEAPQARRVIYVHRGTTNEETAARIATVAMTAQRTAQGQPIPPIFVTSISDAGRPAREVGMISKKYEDTMPDPRLPKDSGGGGGSSGGLGGSSGGLGGSSGGGT